MIFTFYQDRRGFIKSAFFCGERRVVWAVPDEGGNFVQEETPRERPSLETLHGEIQQFEEDLVALEVGSLTTDVFKGVFIRADQLYVRFYQALYDGKGQQYPDVSEINRVVIQTFLEELRIFLLYDMRNFLDIIQLFQFIPASEENLDEALGPIRGNPSRFLARVLMRRYNASSPDSPLLFGEALRTEVLDQWEDLVGDGKNPLITEAVRLVQLSFDFMELAQVHESVVSFLERSFLSHPHLGCLPSLLMKAGAQSIRGISFEESRLQLELRHLLARSSGEAGTSRESVRRISLVDELIGQLRNRLIELLKLGRRDPLTGLLNRQAWEEDSQKPEKGRRRQTLILADLNGLKLLNEAVAARNVKDAQGNELKGHALGDYVLKKLGEDCFATLRDADMGYRCGEHGDEFVFILPSHVSQDEIMGFIRRLDVLIQRIDDELDLYIYRDFTDRGARYTKDQDFPLGIAFAVAHYFPPEENRAVSSGTPVSLGSMITNLDGLLASAKTDTGGNAYSLEQRIAVVLGRTITGNGVQRIFLRGGGQRKFKIQMG